MKLLVHDLARTTTQTELRQLFEPFGTIQYCALVLDQQAEETKQANPKRDE